MAWETPTADTVLSEFTPTELASITTLMGGAPLDNTSLLGQIVARVIKEVRGYINAGNYSLDADTTKIPDGLFEDLIAISRWRLLVAVPMLKQLQTDERRKAFESALAKLTLIAEGKFDVDPVDPAGIPKTGMWNAENKLIMRTHPIPRPATQFTPQIDTYANPNAPADTENTPPPP